jgi:hypothetical protein
VWDGAIEDSGFRRPADQSEWSVERGATIAADASGHRSDGEARIPNTKLCEGGTISQSVSMPAYNPAEPHVLEFSTLGECVVGNCFDENASGLLLGVDGRWTHHSAPGREWDDKTVCLGPAWYGGTREVRLRSSREFVGQCYGDGHLAMDDVSIRPAEAGECPPPGTVPGGDFEDDTSRWTTTGSVTIAEEIGRGPSRGVRFPPGLGSNARLDQRVTYPRGTDQAAPAIELEASIPEGSTLHLRTEPSDDLFGERNPHRVSGDGRYRTYRICLPRWQRGRTHRLVFRAEVPEESSRGIWVDNISVVQASECSNDRRTSPVGGDFEYASDPAVSVPWSFEIQGLYVSGEPFDRVVDDPDKAAEGRGALKFGNRDECEGNYALTRALIPEASRGSGGPALRLDYRTENLSGHFLYIDQVDRDAGDAPRFSRGLSESSSWTSALKCLPPERAGVPSTIEVALRGSFDGSCPSDPTVWLDNVELTTDSSCPAR